MKDSKIEWTHHTFNPWRGCAKVSAGCANCYAETLSGRNPGTLGVWGPNGTRVVASESMWREPLKWDKAAAKAGERHRVFCASLADVFEDWRGPMMNSHGEQLFNDKSGDIETTMQDVRSRLFKLIDATPHLDWLLLTKRPENIARMMTLSVKLGGVVGVIGTAEHDWPRRNVWIGASVENQAAADERIPHLLKVPAAVRFLSMEPLLGPVEFSNVSKRSDCVQQLGRKALDGIHWVIVGGESGPNARPMHPDWARSIRDQCEAVGVPFFFKQWGNFAPTVAADSKVEGVANNPTLKVNDPKLIVLPMANVGKKAAGRVLDGMIWDKLPSVA